MPFLLEFWPSDETLVAPGFVNAKGLEVVMSRGSPLLGRSAQGAVALEGLTEDCDDWIYKLRQI
jgi:hypothetical protein